MFNLCLDLAFGSQEIQGMDEQILIIRLKKCVDEGAIQFEECLEKRECTSDLFQTQQIFVGCSGIELVKGRVR